VHDLTGMRLDEGLLHRCMRFLGTACSFGTIFWRYVNIPENWGWVGGLWSLLGVGLWFAGDVVYPFVYYHVRMGKAKRA